MTTYVLCDSASGEIVSSSKAPILKAAPSREVIQTDKVGVWDASTKDFVDFPVDKRMPTLAFIELFTDAEFNKILAAAKLSVPLEGYILKMTTARHMDLSYPPTIKGINELATGNLITVERAAEILNG